MQSFLLLTWIKINDGFFKSRILAKERIQSELKSSSLIEFKSPLLLTTYGVSQWRLFVAIREKVTPFFVVSLRQCQIVLRKQ